MITFLFLCALIYSGMIFVEHKVPGLTFSTKQRLLISAGAAFFWPVTLLAGAGVVGAGLYHTKVKELPFVSKQLQGIGLKKSD